MLVAEAALDASLRIVSATLAGTGRDAHTGVSQVQKGRSEGSLGLAGGRSLGEGGGLALAGAGRLVELAPEPLVLGL
jgi:hypothetical protein